ncbi:putative NAD(P)(+) transhydrogenase (Re/Si-specific) [Microsporum canis]
MKSPAPPPPPAAPKKDDAAISADTAKMELTPFQKVSREVATVTGGMGTALALGKFTGPLFMSNVFTAGLAGLIGYRVVWGVSPALHSPLMSVTNAISGNLLATSKLRTVTHLCIGMVGIGGLFVMGGGYFPETIPQALGALSVLLAFVNVSGGFVITKRMLDMFKRMFLSPWHMHPLLILCRPYRSTRIPVALCDSWPAFRRWVPCSSQYWNGWSHSGWIPCQQYFMHQYVPFCLIVIFPDVTDRIGSISGLASQATARAGNSLGILGVSSGILASLVAVGFSPEVLAQFVGLAGIGGLVG